MEPVFKWRVRGTKIYQEEKNFKEIWKRGPKERQSGLVMDWMNEQFTEGGKRNGWKRNGGKLSSFD